GDAGRHGLDARWTTGAEAPERIHDSPDRPEKPDERRRARGRRQKRQELLELDAFARSCAPHRAFDVRNAGELGAESFFGGGLFLGSKPQQLLVTGRKHGGERVGPELGAGPRNLGQVARFPEELLELFRTATSRTK